MHMRRKILIGLLSICVLAGCVKEEYVFPGEENINAYVYNLIEATDLPDFELEPSIEDLFLTAFKAKFVNIELDFLKDAMSDDGILIDSRCTSYLSIGSLSAVCQGDASLYIDGQLIRTYTTSEKNGYSYMQLSQELTKRITSSLTSATWSADSVKGKRLRVSFYMDEGDWDKAVIDKDPFKYMAIDVRITDD